MEMKDERKIVFVRHKVIREKEENKEKLLEKFKDLRKENKVALIWGNDLSFEPKYYEAKGDLNAARQFQCLNDCFLNGAVVVARYEGFDDGVLIGEIRCGAEKKEFISCGSVVLKAVKLENASWERFADHQRLLIAPGRRTINCYRTKDRRYIINLFERKPLPVELRSLHPSQMEVLCYEYLKYKNQITGLLLPIGSSLATVDVLGLRINAGNSEKVIAQVTFERDNHKIKEKYDKLGEFGENCKKYFFGPRKVFDSNLQQVEYIAIEDVFDEMKAISQYKKLILEMIK